MKRLTLMRHGNAQWKDPQISDFDRPLNRRGISEAEAMSRRLIELKLVPTLLLSSSAVRAQQTADIVARELKLPARHRYSEESLYLAPVADILRAVHNTGPRIPHLMIVGHNPGISELVQLFAPAQSTGELSTAAICSMTFDTRTWAQLAADNFRDAVNETPPTGLFALWA